MSAVTTTHDRAPLRRDEQAALRAYESTIEHGLSTFIRVGNALAAIRDARLYRITHATFENYCAERWKLGRQRAYSLIDAAQTAIEMSEISDTPPTVESHAQALSKAATEQRADVWNETVESAPKDADGQPQITARHVRSVVENHAPKTKARKPQTTAGEPLGPHRAPRRVGLNDAVAALRRAVERDVDSIAVTLAALRDAASHGLYGPQTRDPARAFRELVDVVAILLEKRS